MRAKVDLNLARTLIDHGADIECLDNRKRTPFHTFFSPIVSKLAQHCPESMNAMTKDAGGMTLAHYFSWTCASSPADFQVLPNIDNLLKARDEAGRTPLHFAAQRGNIPVMEYLLSQYQVPASMQPDSEGNTPLHEAVQSSRAPAAITLLLAHGFSLEQRNEKGHTVFQHAVLWGTVPATQMLFERDPGFIAWRDKDGQNMLTLARQTENVDVEAWLEKHFGKEDTRLQGVSTIRDIDEIPAGIGVWRTAETMVTLSIPITIMLALLLSCMFPLILSMN